jgi:hypothetical protein
MLQNELLVPACTHACVYRLVHVFSLTLYMLRMSLKR